MIAKNDEVVKEIVNHALDFYDIPFEELQAFMKEAEAKGRFGDRTVVKQCLGHFVRDWADEGVGERVETFSRVLGTLEGLFPDRARRCGGLKVLVPGSGLGRLAYEIAGLGGTYVSFSYFRFEILWWKKEG